MFFARGLKMRATNPKTYLLMSVLLVGALCISAVGKTIYVDNDGPADFNNIQAGIDASADGDTVLIAPGTYTGEGNRDIDFEGKAITVKSEEGPQTCIIDCQGSKDDPHRGFQFVSGEGRDSVLAGFKIINGNGPEIRFVSLDRSVGGAVLCMDSSPTIFGCVIDRNFTRRYGYGGGIYCSNSAAAITKCIVQYNNAGFFGGGIFCDGGSVVIDQCTLISNTADSGGGIYFGGGTGSVRNCLISSNLAHRHSGGGVFCHEEADVTLNNCTVIQNLVSGGQISVGGVGTYYRPPERPIILTNCILWGNLRGDECNVSTQTSVPYVRLSYSCVEGLTPELAGAGNFGVDPLLTPDFHLQADSACIDTGDPNTSLTPSATDIDGELRSTGGQVDIGCDEYIDLDTDMLPDFWERKHFGTTSSTEGGQDPDDDQWPNIQEYNRGSNPIYPPGTFYVDALNGDDNWDGLSAVWDGEHGPKATIQAAMNQASVSDHDRVVLAPGSYTGQGNCDIDFKGKAISVESEDPNDPAVVALTIVDCKGREGNPHRGFIFTSGEDNRSILRGISIVGGYVNDKGGAINCDIGSSPMITNCSISRNESSGYGGGIYCGPHCDPLILKCSIKYNTAVFGAAVASDEFSIPRIEKCSIQANTAWERGGAISASGFIQEDGPVIIDCAINDNRATTGGAVNCVRSNVTVSNSILNGNVATDSGGAVFCVQSAPSFTNCTFVNNHAENLGGAFCGTGWRGEVLFENCIIWGNSASAGDAMARFNCGHITGCPSVRITYCCLPLDTSALAPEASYGWNVEDNNIDVDPLFVAPGYWADVNDPDIVVEPNDPSVVWIQGDYHLRSQAGRWDPKTQSWVQDDITSPCIDAGDPNSPIGHEPFPNGGIINIGAYGSTAEASKSYFGAPVCETIIAGDINGDCKVDSEDLAIMLFHWLEER